MAETTQVAGEVIKGHFPEEPFDITKRFWEMLQATDPPVGSNGVLEAVFVNEEVRAAAERVIHMEDKLYNAKTTRGSMTYLKLGNLARHDLEQAISSSQENNI